MDSGGRDSIGSFDSISSSSNPSSGDPSTTSGDGNVSGSRRKRKGETIRFDTSRNRTFDRDTFISDLPPTYSPLLSRFVGTATER